MNNYFKYLNISDTEEKWGFYITTVGYSRVDANQRYPNNKDHPQSHYLDWNKGRILNGYYIIFISRGQGVFESAQTHAVTISEGTCFFLYPGVWHRYKPDPESGWEEYWIGFKGYYADKLMNNVFFNASNPFIKAGLNRELLFLLQKVLETVSTSAAGYHQVTAGVTLQILGLLNATSVKEDQLNDPAKKLISKALFILQETFDTRVNMEKLAKELPMSYSSFRKAFKRNTGVSPNQYLLDLRLNKAKDLLTSTALNINEVANQTGFESLYYFSKLFKKKNKVSPKSFRSLNSAK